MKKEVPVSILIPTFNRKEYLKNAIQSAQNQTVRTEIVVCDHGSTDGTDEMMQQNFRNITYIRKKNDFGIHFCWLEGVLNCTYDWIHINFDDDWIEPTFAEKLYSLTSPETGFVFCNVKMYEEKDGIFNSVNYFSEQSGHYKSLRFERLFSDDYAISPGCTLLRKKIMLDCIFGGDIPLSKTQYKGVGSDMLFTLLPLNKYPNVGFINENLAIFRSHQKSITVKSFQNDNKTKQIKAAYREAKKLYFLSKLDLSYKQILFLLNLKQKWKKMCDLLKIR